VGIPSFQDITLPLLRLAGDGQIHHLSEARTHLAQEFHLTLEELDEKLPSGKQSRWANRVAWAKVYLEKVRIFDSPGRGQFRITDRGREVLRNPPARLDLSYLQRFPELAEFRNRTRASSVGSAVPVEQSEITPEEELESAYERLQTELAEDVLAHVRRLSPTAFEQLVVDVMLAMGYGGGSPEAGSITPASGDEGIDGVINEDRLGLDVIYVQAKRWENPVSRPEIQKFVGALHGRRARKGVFITTSRFTSDARGYVEHIDPRVVLIDGERLARLMIDHGVGVSTKDTLRVQRVDSDYFADE